MAATFLATSAYPAATALVEQPRPFGYVVGDVMTQRVLLEIDGRELVPAGVPKAQRVNLWLERRPARIESLPDGRRWLAIDYQVINAPQSLTTVNLPAFDLQGAADGATLKIAAWPISVNALTSDGSSELRPDHPAPGRAYRGGQPPSPYGCRRWWSYWHRAQVGFPILPPLQLYLLNFLPLKWRDPRFLGGRSQILVPRAR